MKTLVIMALALLTVFSFSMTAQAASGRGGDGNDNRIDANLFGILAGEANYIPGQKFEVGVNDACAYVGQTLSVYLDGASQGTMMVEQRISPDGTISCDAELQFRTRDGEIVPVVNAGALVEVKLGAILLSSGNFPL